MPHRTDLLIAICVAALSLCLVVSSVVDANGNLADASASTQQLNSEENTVHSVEDFDEQFLDQVRTHRALQLSQPGEQYGGWAQCYGEDASPSLTVNRMTATLVPTKMESEPAIQIQLTATANTEISGGRWRFMIWQASTGDRITYKGEGPTSPYNFCCDFFSNSNCTFSGSHIYEKLREGEEGIVTTVTDCPIQAGTQFTGTITKPLFRNDVGDYDVQVTLVDTTGEELACAYIRIPWKGHNPSQWRAYHSSTPTSTSTSTSTLSNSKQSVEEEAQVLLLAP